MKSRDMATKEQLVTVAGWQPEEGKPKTQRGRSGAANRIVLDVESSLAKWGVEISSVVQSEGNMVFKFSCPWEAAHAEETAPTAYAIEFEDGGAHAGCFHQSCRKGWRALAERFGDSGSAVRGEPERVRFRLLDLNAMMTKPNLDWLAPGIAPKGGFGVLVGQPGVGKSFLALDMALSVASGVPWLDAQTVAGDVIYIVAEGSSGMKARLAAWAEEHEAVLPGPFADSRIHFLDRPVHFLIEEDAEFFLETIEASGLKPVLIVVDTLARSMAGGDENSAKDVGQFICGIDRIREATGAAVWVVHHSGKAGGSPYRGSSALEGACDTMLSLEESKGGGKLFLKCHKQKDAAAFSPIPLVLVGVGGSCVIERAEFGGFVQPVAPKVASGRDKILRALVGFGEGRPTSAELCEAGGVPARTGARIIKELVGEQLIENLGSGNRSAWSLCQSARALSLVPAVSVMPS